MPKHAEGLHQLSPSAGIHHHRLSCAVSLSILSPHRNHRKWIESRKFNAKREPWGWAANRWKSRRETTCELLTLLHNWMVTVAKSHLWPKLFSLFSDRAMRIPPWMWLFHNIYTNWDCRGRPLNHSIQNQTAKLCQFVSVQGGLKEGI